MNITLVLQQKLHAAIRAVTGRVSSATQVPTTVQTSASRSLKSALPCALANATRRAPTGSAHPRLSSKPLRVVRILESGQTRSSVGRMVISGRMADVCAELDRLVAHEAKLH